MGGIQVWVAAVLLVSLRIVPALAFSPPFTLIRIPALVRVMLCLAISAWIVSAHPAQTVDVDIAPLGLLAVVLSELVIGLALALPIQLAFAALMTVGRTIDLQAGYAFAMIADPGSRAHLPLIAMLFAYAAAAIFFATDGPADLLAIWSYSVEHLPLGSALGPDALNSIAVYAGAVFLMAFGAGGLVLLVLFLIDGSIALMSRTLPQMNVMFLGFQVKAVATLIVLPVALAGSGALFARLMRFALDTMLRVA